MDQMQLTHDQVMEILPHRDPMLLVGEVRLLIPMECIETSFFVDPAMDVFRGHFPGDPVFPGVLSVECMAQAVDIMTMTAPKYAGLTPLFLGMNDVRFKKKILPGDTLICRARVTAEREDKKIITCAVSANVNDQQVVSGEITIAMR